MITKRIFKDNLYEQVARIAKAVANPKRLELVELLCQAPKAVEVLAREAGISMKLASAHLKALKAARLVVGERQGKNITYRLTTNDVARLWVTIRLLAEDRLLELQHAVQQLRQSAQEWDASNQAELLRKARNGDVVVIDVRPADEYDAGHLPYARSIPLAELKTRLKELPRKKPVVAYCRGPFCLMAVDAVRLLNELGFDALHLRDGVAEWNAGALRRNAGRSQNTSRRQFCEPLRY